MSTTSIGTLRTASSPIFRCILISLLSFVGVVACAESASDTASDATADATDSRLESDLNLGETCTQDAECASGLCLMSEYAPLGFCTSECETDGAPCAAPDGELPTGYCVKMPEEFLGPINQFCAPLCKTKQECSSLSSTWETCAEPEYRGNPLYPSEVGVFVCQSPSSLGQQPVDAMTCANWRDGYADFVTQQNICTAYCDYLSTCGVSPANPDCCAYGCMLSMVVQGELDVLYEKEKKCMVTAYDGFRNTTQWCSAPPEQCNSEWKDTSP